MVIGKADFIFGTDHAKAFHTADFGFFHLQRFAVRKRKLCTDRSENDGLACSHVRSATDNLNGFLAIVHRRDMQVITIRVSFTGENLCHDELFILLRRFFHAFDFKTDGGQSLRNFFSTFRKIHMTAEPIQRNFHLQNPFLLLRA